MRRAALVVGALVVALLVATAGPARAHASLVASDPPDGARLDEGPATVHLTFSEDISVALGGIRVVDGEGDRMDRGAARADGPEVTVDLAPDLPDGTYVISYRIISADGHPVRGSGVFAVGAAPVDEGVARQARAGDDDGRWEVVGDAGRALAYGGTLLAAGGAVFLAAAHRGGVERRGLRRLLVAAALVGAAGSLAALPVLAALGTGKGPGSLFEPGVLGEVARDGVGLALGLCLVGLLVVVLSVERRPALAVAGAAVAATSFAATGHTRVGDLAALATVTDAAHLLMVATWGGGAVFLWWTLRSRHRADPPPDPLDTTAVVVRFSTIATVGVLAAAATGLLLGWREVRSLDALTGTTYGRLLLAKVAVVAVIAALGAYNHFRLLPAMQQGKARAARQRLLVTAGAESLLLVAVVVITSVLVLETPGRVADEGGPVERVIQLSGGVGSVQLVVAPAQAGSNQIHLFTFDPEGRPAELADAIELELSLPSAQLGPIARTATRAGPAHAQLDSDDLAVAGRWQITVRLRIDRFTEATGTAEVPISG